MAKAVTLSSHVTSIAGLGLLYFRGAGGHQNYEKAAEMFAKAAANGVGVGEVHLACLYMAGKGVPHNYEEAVKWFR